MEGSAEVVLGDSGKRVRELGLMEREVGAAMADVDRRRSDARRLPIDDTRQAASQPQHVPRVVVAVDEAALGVEDRPEEQFDRAFPDPAVLGPGRRLVAALRVVAVLAVTGGGARSAAARSAADIPLDRSAGTTLS